jgi:hypothetical protein
MVNHGFKTWLYDTYGNPTFKVAQCGRKSKKYSKLKTTIYPEFITCKACNSIMKRKKTFL